MGLSQYAYIPVYYCLSWGGGGYMYIRRERALAVYTSFVRTLTFLLVFRAEDSSELCGHGGELLACPCHVRCDCSVLVRQGYKTWACTPAS